MHSVESTEHKGWHRRGFIPHFDQAGSVQFITYRLADSLPAELRRELAAIPVDERHRRVRRAHELLDNGLGACWLRQREIAELVQSNLQHFDGQRYSLIAWAVMPNHVHAVVQQSAGWPLGQVVQGCKSYTAKQASLLLGRSGTFWQADYFDQLVQDERQLESCIRYVEFNPVAAGLCRQMQEWPYSSAVYRGGPSV